MSGRDPLADILGEVATRIGLSRVAGQCFACVWRAAQAPCADDIVASLGLSRSNVSTALKELRAWHLIAVARTPGDRKEYFTAPADPWDVLRLVIAGRQRQVLAPMIDRLLELEADGGGARAAALHDAASALAEWLAALAALSPGDLAATVAGRRGDAGGKKKKKKKKG